MHSDPSASLPAVAALGTTKLSGGSMFFRILSGLIIALFFMSSAHATEGKLKVVTSTTLFADLVRQVGGDRVEVKAVASPKFNIHFIEPKPGDVRNVSKADLYVFAGLDLEAWSDPLVEAAGKPAFFRGGPRSLDLSRGIRLLKAPEGPLSRSEGDMHLFGNPHYQLNPENAGVMTAAILEKLKELDPKGAEIYEENQKNFLQRLNQKTAEWKRRGAVCAGKEIYSYHDDIVYFTEFLGLKSELFLEPKPGVLPTPKHLELLEERTRGGSVKAVVMPTYYPRQAAERLAKRIGVPVVVVAQNPGELSEENDFFSFFEANVKRIEEACR